MSVSASSISVPNHAAATRYMRTSVPLLAAMAACATREPASPRVEAGFESVSFLVGDWEGPSADGSFDEHWLAPRGGMMLGLGREVAPTGAASFFELLRIERRADGLFLVPQPEGRPGHDFKLVRAARGAIVFENDGDDRVSRISYARTGDELTAHVLFREGARTEAFHLRRVACAR